MPQSNFDDARKFFTWLKPPFLSVYTIEPDGKLAFRSGTTPLRQLLDEYKNTYFSVAVPVGGLRKKALKSELVSTQFVHVDLDPVDGQDPLKEQDRLLDVVTEGRPKDVPPPSCIIASGRGIQALWKLKEPCPLPQKIYDIESINLWLIDRLNAPPGTHNVDRILRVPGSWNALDQKKINKGYLPRLAHLIEVNTNEYTLEDFGRWAEPAIKTDDVPYVAATDDITDVPVRVADLGKYDKIKLPLRIKWLIAYGTPADHLDDYVRDFGPIPGNRNPGDRSAWLYDVVCNMLRFGVDRGEILGIITDKAWGISGHCLDQKDPDRAARRQLARALRTVQRDAPKPDPKPPEPDPTGPDEPDLRSPQTRAVHEINERYFAILNGGKLQYYRIQGPKIVALDKPAMEFELGDKFVAVSDSKGKNTFVPAFKLWKTHEERRYYKDGFILQPPVNSGPETCYNLWKGFAVAPAKGDWDLLRKHVEVVLSAGNSTLAEYILNWTAWTFQNPATPPGTALVFRGAEGSGKGEFCNGLVDIFGMERHGLRIQSMRHLVGQFNAHLRYCCLLFCDEAVTPGSDAEGALKGLVTEPNIPIEAKGIDVVNMPNHLHVIMASNLDYVVPAGPEARRWVICDVSSDRVGDSVYHEKLRAHMADGGLAAMLFDMLDWDLSKFRPYRDAPNTTGLSEQKALSLSGFERYWFDCLRAGEAPFSRFTDRDASMPFIATSTIRNVAAERLRTEVTLVSVSKLYHQLGYHKDDTSRPRGFVIPNLKEARKIWDDKRFKIQWDNTPSWSALDLMGEKSKRVEVPENGGDQLF